MYLSTKARQQRNLVSLRTNEKWLHPPNVLENHHSDLEMEMSLLLCTAAVARAVSRCIIGGFMGGSFGRVPDVGWLKSVQTKAVEMGGSWGQLSAAFSGFTSLSTIVRGRYVETSRALCDASRDLGMKTLNEGACHYFRFIVIFDSVFIEVS